LDLALVVSENALIFKHEPNLLEDELEIPRHDDLPVSKEREVGMQYLSNICPGEVDEEDVEILFSCFQRQVYQKGDVLSADHVQQAMKENRPDTFWGTPTRVSMDILPPRIPTPSKQWPR